MTFEINHGMILSAWFPFSDLSRKKKRPVLALSGIDKHGDVLQHAYRLVRSNKGAPGIDGVSFEAIEANEGVEKFLEGLAEEVKNRTYRPMPVRRVMIPKPDGSQRPLGIPDKKGDSLLSSPAKPETGKSETVPFLSRWP